MSRPVISLAEKDLHRLGGSHHATEASREGDRGGEVRVVPLFVQVVLHHPTTDALSFFASHPQSRLHRLRSRIDYLFCNQASRVLADRFCTNPKFRAEDVREVAFMFGRSDASRMHRPAVPSRFTMTWQSQPPAAISMRVVVHHPR